jgi:phenylalanyl-tRNA synthetase alpha chain
MEDFDQKSIVKQAEKEIGQAIDLASLELVSRRYLGDRGLLRSFFKGLSRLPQAQRKQRGVLLNELQSEISAAIDEKKRKLNSVLTEKGDSEELGFDLPEIGHLHPITQTIRIINRLFIEMGYSIMEGPEIETDEYNFGRLNVPPGHPARDMQDTIYIRQPDFLLRTHASSVETRVLAGHQPPLKFVCPGRVYRNEKVNKSNHFIFHHYQGAVVQEKASLKDLFGTLDYLFKKLYGPKVKIRYRNKFYPEVEPGVGPDMQCFSCQGKGCAFCKGVGWIEMGGAGLIHPNILKMAGISSLKWKGFAFGLGLDRWVMAKYNITDIRTLLGGNLAYKYYENENALLT